MCSELLSCYKTAGLGDCSNAWGSILPKNSKNASDTWLRMRKNLVLFYFKNVSEILVSGAASQTFYGAACSITLYMSLF